MIDKIRRRSIIIAMLAIFVTLIVIVGGINLTNIKSIRDYSDSVLKVIAENDGVFPMAFDKREKGFIGIGLTNETPFDTRYFCVKYNDEGRVVDVDTKNISGIDTGDAVVYANKVLDKDKSGYLGDYRYIVYNGSSGKIVVFMDMSRMWATVANFARISVLFSLSALILVFLLLLLFSKRLLRPIEKSYEKQKNFISDASHELKTPMAIISANNELIEMEYGESDSTKAITKQIARMAGMTRNLSALSKIDNLEALSERKKVDISALMQDVAEPYIAVAEQKGMKLSFETEPNTFIIGDESLLRQMIALMLDNAIKYGKSNIILSANNTGYKLKKEVTIIIKNDAENIKQGNLDKYFDRFYRSEESRASGIEGSGIGLSIVKEIANLHKGVISATGKDEYFFITIRFKQYNKFNNSLSNNKYNFTKKIKNKNK